MKLNLL